MHDSWHNVIQTSETELGLEKLRRVKQTPRVCITKYLFFQPFKAQQIQIQVENILGYINYFSKDLEVLKEGLGENV